MKVLHVETGRHLYGGAKQVYYLIKGLYEKGVSNILVCTEGAEIARIVRPYVDKLYEVPMRGDLDLSFILRCYRILKKERPDIVHLHSRRGADVLGGMGARLYGRVRIILTRRVDNPEPPIWAKIKYLLYDRVITISDGIRKVLLREGLPEEKIITVRSAIDTDEIQTQCNWNWFINEFDLPEDAFPIGMVAQFIERKGHRFVLEVAGKIIKAHSKVRFLFFGRGPLEEEIKKQVSQKALTEYFRFCGFREDLKRIYPCLKLLVHPALMEGLGVSLIEASGSGVPVVAFRAGGVPEIVRDGLNGILVDVGDKEGLKNAIVTLVRDETLRQRMAEEGRRFVQREFSVEAMVEGNLRVYKSLLKI